MNRRAFMRLIGAIVAGPLVLLPTPAKAVAMDVDVNRLQGQTQTLTFYDEAPDRQSFTVAYYAVYDGKMHRVKLDPITAEQMYLDVPEDADYMQLQVHPKTAVVVW